MPGRETQEPERQQTLVLVCLGVVACHLAAAAFLNVDARLFLRDLLAGAGVACAGLASLAYRRAHSGLARGVLALGIGAVVLATGLVVDGLRVSGDGSASDYSGFAMLCAGAWLCVRGLSLLIGEVVARQPRIVVAAPAPATKRVCVGTTAGSRQPARR